MAMSSLTYILGFSLRFFSASLFRLGILWDKNHIKIFCSEIWVEMILGWPTFKIMCNDPIFYFNYRCQIENQVSDYRLLGASSYLYVCMFNLYWFSWNMNLEVYMVHWMTFVNCFGALYTLICTVLLTHVHTLKIILLDWFYLLIFLLYLLFCREWCFFEISFWYFLFLFLLVLPIIFVLWIFANLLYIFCILIVWNIVCSIKL